MMGPGGQVFHSLELQFCFKEECELRERGDAEISSIVVSKVHKMHNKAVFLTAF